MLFTNRQRVCGSCVGASGKGEGDGEWGLIGSNELGAIGTKSTCVDWGSSWRWGVVDRWRFGNRHLIAQAGFGNPGRQAEQTGLGSSYPMKGPEGLWLRYGLMFRERGLPKEPDYSGPTRVISGMRAERIDRKEFVRPGKGGEEEGATGER